ncbi:glycosyltransferase [Streptomyces anulatus]|uniref:glycosyltransferase n=1 Tax=Streptomyces anulatus TaxID=1892 RepID=UPI00366065B9
MLKEAEADGVHFGGPASKAEVAEIYARWDAMVLILIGGRFVTSGKVYEYMATGLPIVSAHVVEHDASNVLRGHPLWTGAVGLDVEAMTDAFVRAAHLAVDTSDEAHAEAMAHADQYTRESLMTVAVRELIDRLSADKPERVSVKGVSALPEKSIVTGGPAS